MGVMPPCVVWNGESYYGDGARIYTQEDSSAVEEIPSLLQELDLEEIPSITVLCRDDPESIAVANGFLVAWNQVLGNAFNLDPLQEGELQARIASGSYEAALYTLRAGGTTPYDVLRSFESTASPTLLEDETFDQTLRSLSFDLASYREAETLLAECCVFYPIFQDTTYYAVNPNTRGITVAPDQNVDFTGARKK